jgi:hypothetical protein
LAGSRIYTCMEQTTAEHERLRRPDEGSEDWRAWGPYLSERAWSTVREDYSELGEAWDFFPHDHARSRVYRWNEDGMAGVCDLGQRFCLALALWNGVAPILKERMFGLTGPQGNHGEDVKEYWWYLDATPTHSWARWRYHYPQRAFPYNALVHHGRGRDEPAYELVDRGLRRPPVLGSHGGPCEGWADRPVHADHGGEPGAGSATLCDNETNAQRLWEYAVARPRTASTTMSLRARGASTRMAPALRVRCGTGWMWPPVLPPPCGYG